MAGDIKANYWDKIKSGEIERHPDHGKRGKDKRPRSLRPKKTVVARYREATGRRIEDDMKAHRDKVDMMFQVASMIEDPADRFEALNKATTAEANFNKTWLPYMQAKQGTYQKPDEDDADRLTLDDIMHGALEDKSDEDSRG